MGPDEQTRETSCNFEICGLVKLVPESMLFWRERGRWYTKIGMARGRHELQRWFRGKAGGGDQHIDVQRLAAEQIDPAFGQVRNVISVHSHLSALQKTVEVLVVTQHARGGAVPKGARRRLGGGSWRMKSITYPVSGSKTLVFSSLRMPQSPKVLRWMLAQNFWAIFLPNAVE